VSHFNRRGFLGTSLGGMAAALITPLNQVARAEDAAPAAPGAGPSLPDSLFLSWQRDPTSTMTVQWVGPENGAGKIEYSLVGDAATQSQDVALRPFPDTDLKVHRCELTGLKPGTEYQFNLGGSVGRFRTMPEKATNTIQFISGGDCGTADIANATSIMAAKQEPHFALIGGDLAYDNGNSPDTFLTFLRNYSRHMVDPQGRLIPMVTCPGNHETNDKQGSFAVRAPHYMSVFDGFFTDTTYNVLDIGDYLSLVLLDSGHLSPIGGAQADWLGATLAARQDRRHLIVANHVPAYPSYRAPEGENGGFGCGEENRMYWSPHFERYNVDVVLEHHDHTFKRSHRMTGGMKDKNGVLYLGDGSWGQIRAPKTPEERPYLAAVSQAYHMTVHRLEGDDRYHVAIDSTGKVADVCMTAGKRPAKRG
jgi:hypothetical protein